MKKIPYTFLFIMVSVIVILYSCSKANEKDLSSSMPTTCDTVNMHYQSDVVPILQANCYSCHGKDTYAANSGFELEGYSNLKIRVDNGKLIGAITHASGFVPMPYNLAKLSDCDINKIKDWVLNGAQNN